MFKTIINDDDQQFLGILSLCGVVVCSIVFSL